MPRVSERHIIAIKINLKAQETTLQLEITGLLRNQVTGINTLLGTAATTAAATAADQ